MEVAFRSLQLADPLSRYRLIRRIDVVPKDVIWSGAWEVEPRDVMGCQDVADLSAALWGARCNTLLCKKPL